MWFTEYAGNKIGNISTAGQIDRIHDTDEGMGPEGIVESGGSIWFAEHDAGKIGQLTPGGAFTEYVIPSPNSGPTRTLSIQAVVSGFRTVWQQDRQVGRIALKHVRG